MRERDLMRASAVIRVASLHLEGHGSLSEKIRAGRCGWVEAIQLEMCEGAELDLTSLQRWVIFFWIMLWGHMLCCYF